jgi:two-component system OmpR family response regulator
VPIFPGFGNSTTTNQDRQLSSPYAISARGRKGYSYPPLANTAGLHSDSTPLRVLLIEDHPDLAAATAAALEAGGLEVRTARSGQEALEIASTFQPQLLLCDINLPDMSGLEVVRKLRSNPSNQRTYLVTLTGAAGIDATQAQVDLCLTKPITLEAIAMLVQAARRKADEAV